MKLWNTLLYVRSIIFEFLKAKPSEHLAIYHPFLHNHYRKSFKTPVSPVIACVACILYNVYNHCVVYIMCVVYDLCIVYSACCVFVVCMVQLFIYIHFMFQNTKTVAEVKKLMSDKNHDELHKRFCGRISFGTAGRKCFHFDWQVFIFIQSSCYLTIFRKNFVSKLVVHYLGLSLYFLSSKIYLLKSVHHHYEITWCKTFFLYRPSIKNGCWLYVYERFDCNSGFTGLFTDDLHPITPAILKL